MTDADTRPQRGRVLVAMAATLVVLLAAEIAMRLVAPRVSGNVAASQTLRVRASAFAAQPGHGLLLLGNSLTGRGIDISALQSARPDLSPNQSAASVLTMDSSNIWYWLCIVQMLPPTQKGQKYLLIGYAWDDLADQSPMNVEKTFGLVCPLTNLTSAATLAGLGLEGRLRAVAARTTWLFALHADVRHRMMEPLIPDYRQQTNTMNEQASKQARPDSTVGVVRTYSALRRLLNDARESGYYPVIVAMPVVTPYGVDPALPQTVHAEGGLFIDVRHAQGIDATSFDDPIHLSPHGASILAAEIARRLPPPPASASGH